MATINQLFNEEVYVLGCNSSNTAIADGSFPASGSFINVSNYQRFVFLIKAGSLTTALACKVQQATTISGTLKDITGATTTVGATDDDKWHTIEVRTDRLDLNNSYKFVTLSVSGQAGSDDYLDIIFLGLNPGTLPVTQHANYVAAIQVAG